MSKLLPTRNGIVTPKKMIAEQWLIDPRAHECMRILKIVQDCARAEML
jgi:hypothetical protein